jgi:hypothetical protein
MFRTTVKKIIVRLNQTYYNLFAFRYDVTGPKASTTSSLIGGCNTDVVTDRLRETTAKDPGKRDGAHAFARGMENLR